MSTNSILTGALYIRVSTDKQEELSPHAQKRLLLEYAKQHSIFIPPEYVYIEHSISGRTAEKRPKFMEMISTAKQKENPFQQILVWKFSRFARNQEESIVYKSLLKKQCNIDVISISEPLIEGPFGSLIERIIEWMDEYYSIRLSGEVQRGMMENALRGSYQSKLPLGYHLLNHIPTVLNTEAIIVQKIFNDFSYGKDETSIARELNDCGFKTRLGNPFDNRGIHYILNNPFYIGKIRWNYHNNKFSQSSDSSNVILVDGTHQPIISNDLFSLVQQRYLSSKKTKKQRSFSTTKHWITGILKCGYCHKNLVYLTPAQTSAKPRSPYFQCYVYSSGKHSGSCSITEKKVLTLLNQAFFALSSISPQTFYHQPQINDIVLKKQKHLESEQKKIIEKQKKAYLGYLDNLYSKEQLQELQFLLNKKEKELSQKLDNLFSSQQTTLPSTLKPPTILPSLPISFSEKGILIREVISSITFYRKENLFELEYFLTI